MTRLAVAIVALAFLGCDAAIPNPVVTPWPSPQPERAFVGPPAPTPTPPACHKVTEVGPYTGCGLGYSVGHGKVGLRCGFIIGPHEVEHCGN